MCPVNSRIIELQFSCIALFTLESVQIHDGEIKHGLQAERKIDCLQVTNFPCHLMENREYVGCGSNIAQGN